MGRACRKGEFEPVKRKEESGFEEAGRAGTGTAGARALPCDKKRRGKDAFLDKLERVVVGKPTGRRIWKGSDILHALRDKLGSFSFILSCFYYEGLKDHDEQ